MSIDYREINRIAFRDADGHWESAPRSNTEYHGIEVHAVPVLAPPEAGRHWSEVYDSDWYDDQFNS